MLKIKDNVNLEKLKEYGFSYTEGEDYHKSNYNMFLSLGDNRELNINCDDKYFDEDILECVEWIYDLIKAGFVEKVSED